MSADLLEQAIALSQAGKQQEACDLLVQVIAADVHDEMAWLWYAYTLATRSERVQALQECLHHNPCFQEARERLAGLAASEPLVQQKPEAEQSTAGIVTEIGWAQGMIAGWEADLREYERTHRSAGNGLMGGSILLMVGVLLLFVFWPLGLLFGMLSVIPLLADTRGQIEKEIARTEGNIARFKGYVAELQAHLSAR